jgi:AraC-like DNA-binding protein
LLRQGTGASHMAHSILLVGSISDASFGSRTFDRLDCQLTVVDTGQRALDHGRRHRDDLILISADVRDMSPSTLLRLLLDVHGSSLPPTLVLAAPVDRSWIVSVLRLLPAPAASDHAEIVPACPPAAVWDPRVVSVVARMKSRGGDQFEISELAKMVNLSESRLRHLFRAHTGQSLTSFSRCLRLAEAGRLLRTTCLSVKEVCHRSGFNDRRHFAREFRHHYGSSPQAWRRSPENGRPAVTEQLNSRGTHYALRGTAHSELAVSTTR